MNRLRAWRIDQAIEREMASAVRHHRSTRRLFAQWGEQHEDLGVTRTVEPVLNSRRGHWRWDVQAKVGPRVNCSMYSEAPAWHPGPLHFRGVALSGLDADADSRAVEAMLRAHHARCVVQPLPMEVQT